MKKTLFFAASVMMMSMVISCAGSGSSKSTKQATVSLDELDDYYTVKSYSIESDALEKGAEKLNNVKGTLTLVIARNNQEMKYKPSDISYAEMGGEISGSMYYVFRGDCDAVVKQIVKMAPGSEQTFTIGFKGVDPYNQFRSEEDNATARQEAFEALTKKGALDQICFDIEFVDEESYNDDDDEKDDDEEDDDEEDDDEEDYYDAEVSSGNAEFDLDNILLPSQLKGKVEVIDAKKSVNKNGFPSMEITFRLISPVDTDPLCSQYGQMWIIGFGQDERGVDVKELLPSYKEWRSDDMDGKKFKDFLEGDPDDTVTLEFTGGKDDSSNVALDLQKVEKFKLRLTN